MSMVSRTTSTWLATTTFTLTFAALSAYLLRNKWRNLTLKIRELEIALKASLDNNAAERQGRIRAQQALRKALLEQKTNSLEQTTYPMVPIGIVQSCFSTRNGTPRQPLLVPLARACLMFDPVRVPPASLEGLEEYSHIWIVYVFHLNTDIEKLWMEPSRSKVKAKVRVPRLKGGKKGVFATRSPHRPSPIGLTVAKIEAVQGNMILLSGVDLVDGTPILDVKPYLPYCDSIKDAAVPEWVKADSSLAVASVTFSEGFSSALETCWELVEGSTLYSSPSEIKRLIEQILSWDIRSPAQRNRPHKSLLKSEFCGEPPDNSVSTQDCEDEETFDPVSKVGASNPIVYHLILEGLDVSYKIDCEGNVLIDSVTPTINSQKSKNRCNYNMWRGKLSN